MSEVMTFRGAYAFLSNMYSAALTWDGRQYRNSEAAFQSAKSLDPAVRDYFSEMAGVVAKREGKKVRLRPDWEAVKLDVMEDIVREKFLQNPNLLKKLIDTGDMELVEGNRWHDVFWGVDIISGEGENHLGIILMKLRTELGGGDYLDNIERIRAKREAAELQARQARDAEIADIEARLAALLNYEFVGMAFATRTFGRVTIKRQEGNLLFFDARGAEKKLSLPGCITQGFLIPDDETMVETYRTRQALQDRLKELQRGT